MKIKERRLAAGISIKRLSELTGIAERTLIYYEAGRDPKASNLKKIAKVFNCLMEDLI